MNTGVCLHSPSLHGHRNTLLPKKAAMTLTCTASLQRTIQTSDRREVLSGSTAHVVLPLAHSESLSVSIGVCEV